MNGIIRRLLGKPVQLVVMTTPSTSLADALALARRPARVGIEARASGLPAPAPVAGAAA